ncbi:MAG: hypothetical protein LKK12_03990 [Bacteroidales bacterium]|nr:hypothetical protein [Bacteroidales bacterium]
MVSTHLCICFIAYKVYKELERMIRALEMIMSADKVLAIAKTITTLRIRLPNESIYTETLYTTPQQEAIKPILDALELALLMLSAQRTCFSDAIKPLLDAHELAPHE